MRIEMRHAILAAALSMGVLSAIVSGPVVAQTWNKGTGNFLWNNAGNWSAGIPGVGSTATFGRIDWAKPIAIDMKGSTLNFSKLQGNYNGSVEVFYHSDFLTPNANPLGTNSSASSVENFSFGGYGSLTAAANASPVLTLGTIDFSKQHQAFFYMPVNVDNLIDNGSNYSFYGNVTANNIIDLNGRGDTTDQVHFYSTVTAPQIDISTRTAATAHGTANFTSMNLDDAQASFTAETGSSVSIGTLNLSSGVFSAKESVNITTFNWTGGTYEAAVDGVPIPANVPQTGELRLSAAQSSFPTVSVAAFGVLSGNLTGADYGGAGKNVTLVEDSIISPTAGPVPTRADVGGAVLGYGVPDANSGGPYLAGDDGSSTIYKFLAFGEWAPNKNVSREFGAVAGSGDLSVVVLSEQDIQNNNTWRGDGTSTTANFSFPTFGSGRIDLNQGLNEGATGPNLIDTFNLSSENERADILRMEGSGLIGAGQTINVDGGRVTNTQQLTGGNLQGTLSISNGQFDQPNDDFTSADTGTLHIGNRGVLAINNTGNFDAFEALGSRLTYSGNPVAMWQGDNNGTVQDPDLANNTVLAGFLANSDWVPNSYKAVTLGSDAALGHGHYIFNTYDRGNGNGWQESGGAKILYAQNGPMDGTDWIGIAATGSNQPMRIEIYAPDATLVVGSTDPTRFFSADNDSIGDQDFYDVAGDKTVQFFNTITAAGLDVQSGTARFSTVDQTFPDLHIGAGATVNVDSGRTVTVTGALGGNGTYSGTGLTVTGTGSLNPGDSIGEITGSTLLLESGATYNWEIADPAGVAGTGWDLSSSAALDIPGTLNFNVIEFGLTADILATDQFVVAAADGVTGFDSNNVVFDVIADEYTWDISGAMLEQLDGDDFTGFAGQDVLVLSGISAQIAAVPEPASLAIWTMIGLILAGFGYYRSRRNRR